MTSRMGEEAHFLKASLQASHPGFYQWSPKNLVKEIVNMSGNSPRQVMISRLDSIVHASSPSCVEYRAAEKSTMKASDKICVIADLNTGEHMKQGALRRNGKDDPLSLCIARAVFDHLEVGMHVNLIDELGRKDRGSR